MTRKTSPSTGALPNPPATPSFEVNISTDGDVLLEIKDAITGDDYRYRCSRTMLRSTSKYFNILLDPIKFSEGIAVEATLQELFKQDAHLGIISASKLPVVVVSDVGQIPQARISASTVIKYFLAILHDPATPWPAPRSESINLVALLATVADRFTATRPIREYLRGQKFDTTLLKDKRSGSAHLRELDNRQRLLAGLIFGFPAWVRECSTALIVDGPRRGVTIDVKGIADEEAEADALWWKLPNGAEGVHIQVLVARPRIRL